MYTSTALIVDDEKDICYLLNSLLRQKNIHANLAGGPAKARKITQNNNPSLIFLDNHLPDGLGLSISGD
jgi:two-component system, OmpR family, response regulator